MAELSAICANIAQMKQQLLNSPGLWLGGRTVPPRRKRKPLDLSSSPSLRIIIRDLKSSESLIRLRESELWL